MTDSVLKKLNLIRIFRLQKGEQHPITWMICQPLADILYLFVILLAEFFQIDRFHVVVSLHLMEMVLPGTREELIEIVMKVAIDQRTPFLVFEPDTVATAAAVKLEIGVREDLVARHNVSTSRAEL